MATSEKIILVFLFAVVVFFGLFKLTESPSFVYDEGWYFQTSANLAQEGIDGLRMNPAGITHVSTYITVGYPLIFSLALWFKIFSVGIFQARFLMFLVLCGFVAVSFLLAKKLFGNRISLATLALIATFPPLYGNGKTVMGETLGIFFLSLFLFSLTCMFSYPHRKTFFIILSGVCAGLCVAVKPFFILLLPALFVGMLVALWRKELSFREMLLGILCTLTPIFVWFFVQFRGGDSIQATLTYYANPYNLGNIYEIIWINFKGLFTNISTLYTVILIGVWVVAFFVRLRLKIKIRVEEIVAITFSVIVMLAYLRTSGMYRYFYPAQMVALIFFPFSAWYLFEWISQKTGIWKSKGMFAALIIFLTLIGAYQLCFNSWVADTYSSRKTAHFEEYFSMMPQNRSYFLYNTPEIAPFIDMAGNKNYYQYIINYFGPMGEENLAVLARGGVDVVIVPTVLFIENENTIFREYIETEKTYKYSILEQRKAYTSGNAGIKKI